jgi:hypothetical protein
MISYKFYYQYVLFLIFSIRTTCHFNLTVLDLTTLKAFRKEYELPEPPNYMYFSSLLLHRLTQFQICSQIFYIYEGKVTPLQARLWPGGR